jgi:3D (Asp-Asp-Asp) domain-containing protein
MQHPDLKSLLWGRHLSRMLGVCGLDHLPSDPAPRVVAPVPGWYQRLAGLLTIAGLVASVYTVDTWIRHRAEPSPWWDGTQTAAFDTTAWSRWAAIDGAGSDPLAGRNPAVRTASQNSRWSTLTHSAPLPIRKRPKVIRDQKHLFQLIQVTAYTSRTSETDTSPSVTATNTTPKSGTIALSRDLLRTFTSGAPFDFGDKLLIPGVGVFEAHDTMHPRWKAKADIWFASPQKARAWGRRTVYVTKVGEDVPTMAHPASGGPDDAGYQGTESDVANKVR